MKNFILLSVILCLKWLDAQASFSPSIMRISAGTGIGVSGIGNISSPIVITNTSPASTPSYNNSPSVTLNNSVQISTTKATRVSYTVAVATSVSLLNLNSAGQAFLEISPNNSTWTTINSGGKTTALSVALSVGLSETNYYNLQGEIPVSYYRRIRTTTSGGGSVTFSSGQEVQY